MLKLILVITFFTTLVFAIFLNARYLHLKIHGHQTTAQIIGYHQRTGNPQSISNADQSYAAIFVFYNNKSEPIEVQSSNYYKEKKYEVGQKVAVYFLHNSFNEDITLSNKNHFHSLKF